MENKKIINDVISNLFANTKDSSSNTDAYDAYSGLFNSINAFINTIADIVGDEKVEETFNPIFDSDKKEEKKDTTCNCGKSCNCHKDDDKANNTCTCTATTIADDLRDFYKKQEESQKISKEAVDSVYKYVMENLKPTEKGGLIEKCGDILRMPINDRTIVAFYNLIDVDTKSNFVKDLIIATGFSGISFETMNKTDLYVIFKF